MAALPRRFGLTWFALWVIAVVALAIASLPVLPWVSESQIEEGAALLK